jgi:hypothetical protein
VHVQLLGLLRERGVVRRELVRFLAGEAAELAQQRDELVEQP